MFLASILHARRNKSVRRYRLIIFGILTPDCDRLPYFLEEKISFVVEIRKRNPNTSFFYKHSFVLPRDGKYIPQFRHGLIDEAKVIYRCLGDLIYCLVISKSQYSE